MTIGREPTSRRRRQLPKWVERGLDIGVLPGDGTEITRTKRLLAGVLWVSLASTTVSGLQLAFVFDAPAAGAVVGTAFLVAVTTLVIMWRRPAAFPGVAHLPIGNAILISAALVVMAGGLLASAVNAVWGFVAVLGALAIFADRRASRWMWFFIASQITAVALARWIEPVYEIADVEYVAVFNLLVVVVFVYFLMFYYVRQRAALLEESDRLLRNVLPEKIADRLKTSDETIADDIESASILFADIVNFTPMSAGMTPVDLVGLLDEVFTALDALVEERGLEKIKTIGDAYMVAAGVPEPRGDHAIVLCDLALAVQQLVAARDFRGHRIRFRIGISSGPVVAGIIGTRKFSYDLWGDAVNTASRMESSGAEDRIQITDATRELVDHAFVCRSEGIVEIKGKGPMNVWTLAGRRGDSGYSPRP